MQKQSVFKIEGWDRHMGVALSASETYMFIGTRTEVREHVKERNVDKTRFVNYTYSWMHYMSSTAELQAA